MSANHADLNLLFGITALQMDFITRDALIDAMHAWTLDKEKQLGDILVEHGDLTLERRTLLDELVEEHLRQHDDDPERSLTVIATDSSVRDALQSIDDAEVQKALTFTSDAPPADTYATQLAPAPTDLDQRFRVLRPHAKGGLGQVFVALDKELQREVALKELQMRFVGSDVTRERFMIEAAVTGGLEHPGVVPVYGLGHYSDGRPYYAMRFIRGDNLKEAIDRFYRDTTSNRNLELRKLLRRFIDVCDAIQYAHSRGVLHRDLKPGNIMLGKYGETLVVDWGLAKPIDSSESPTLLDGPPLEIGSGSGSAPTSMGSVIGTPGYMSPEQASGRLDLLGPASDVYGLGATLYHVLTGQPPFKEKVSEVLKKVERGEFKRPREVRSDVPPALEAICLKAMATQPQDRYGSAFRLAEDIEHWLGDESVSAWKEPATVRVGRWVRRHSALVSSATAAACVGLLVVGVSFFMLQAAYQREQASHARARQVVDDYFTQVSEATLLNQPGTQELRRTLLERATEHYRSFVEDHKDDVTGREELGRAHFRLGVISESIDSQDDAMRELDAAARIQETLVSTLPRATEWFYDLGLTLNARGRLLHKQQDFDAAAKAYKRALEVREQLVSLHPNDTEYTRTLANTHMNIGETLRAQGERDEALAKFQTAQAIRQETIEQDANDARLLRDMAKGLYNLANLQLELGQSDDAEANFNDAVAMLDRLREEGPSDLEVLELRALTFRRLGDLQQAREAFDEAGENYKQAVAVSHALSLQNPSVSSYRETHAAIVLNQSAMDATLGLSDEAINGYMLARDLFEALMQDFPTHRPYRDDYAATCSNLGELLLALESPTDAASVLSEAVDLIDLSDDDVPGRSNLIVGRLLYNAGLSRWSEGNLQRAIQLFDDALRRLQLAIDSELPAADGELHRTEVATQLYALSLAAADQETDEEQLVRRRELSETLRKGLLEAQSDQWISRQVAVRLRTMSRLQWAAEQPPLALKTMELASHQWEQATTTTTDTALMDERDEALGDLAALLLHISESEDDSRKTLERAKEVLLQLVARHPDDDYYVEDLRTAEERLEKLGAPDNQSN